VSSRSVGLTTAAARAVLSLTTRAGGLAAGTVSGLAGQVAQRLREAIQLGILLDGQRLPPEAKLAEQLGVSTVTLREALAVLREQGLVTTRRGRGGGTFVTAADTGGALGRRLRELSVAQLRDLGDHRGAISAMTAQLAAQRVLPAEVADLEEQLDRLRTARSASDRRRAAQQFAVAVAAAAQSPRLLAEEIRLSAEVGDLLWLQASEEDHEAAVAIRARLLAAIKDRDAAAATEAAHRQVSAETARLAELRLNAYLRPLAERYPGKAVPAGHKDVSPAGQAAGEFGLGEVGKSLERLLGVLEALGEKLAGLAASSGPLRRDNLGKLRPAIFDLLAGHRGLASGAGVIAAPDLLADAPLWLEWWWITPAGSPEQLQVNLDPAAPDFFDYTTAAWYTAADRLGTAQATGPYVDYFCTGEYTITLSVPVRAGGRFLGVAAADVLVSQLEGQVLPALLAAGRPVALTSPEGRVIAATTASLLPGARGPEAGAPLTSSPLGRWRLADVSEPADLRVDSRVLRAWARWEPRAAGTRSGPSSRLGTISRPPRCTAPARTRRRSWTGPFAPIAPRRSSRWRRWPPGRHSSGTGG
jgi:GntR family transcriptional regulator, transcriptional repressor for pyruvate dehydrogenase complex